MSKKSNNQKCTRVMAPDGAIYYYSGRKLHRKNGPAIIWPDGSKQYYVNGMLHREDGSAIISSLGFNYYYIHGICHREDGPAVVGAGGLVIVYYLNGKKYSKEEVELRMISKYERLKQELETTGTGKMKCFGGSMTPPSFLHLGQ